MYIYSEPYISYNRALSKAIRFSSVLGTNRLDHDVPEVEAVQNLYTLGGFKEFKNCRFLGFNRPVYRFLPFFGENRLNHRVPEVEAVQNIYTLWGF